MRLAREGYSIVLCTFAVFAAVAVGMAFAVKYAGMPVWLFWAVAVLLFGLCVCVALFFREPTRREYRSDPDTVFSSADGKVVVIEEVFEGGVPEGALSAAFGLHVHHQRTCKLVSRRGEIVYRNNHLGRFFVAWHPKSSEENERTTTVVDTGHERILFRQIAGLVARRIVNYAKVGERAEQNAKYGFIKFGSRIDIFLPLDCEVLVGLGDRVRGGQTPLAKLHRE